MFFHKLRSIKNNKKYIIIILSLILVTLSCLNILSSKNNAIESMQQENKKTLEGVIISLQNFFIERKNDFEVIVNTIKVQKESPITPMLSLFEANGMYKSLSYVDINGNYIYKADQNVKLLSGNIIRDYGESLNDCLSNANTKRTFIISDFFKTNNGKLVIAVAEPVISNQSVKGILVGIIDSQIIGKQTIYSNFVNSNNTIFGVDKNFTRVFSLGEKYIGKNVLGSKRTLVNDISKQNYIMMSKGRAINGVHYSVFNASYPNDILEKATKRYIVSLPVVLENEFKFSLAITTPASAASYIDWFVLRQIALFLFLSIVVAYFLHLFFNDYKENEELQESLVESRENEKHITEFFCNMSHELRTPLTIILSGIHFIYKKCGNSLEQDIELSKTLHKIKQNAFRLLKMVNNLLEISKLDYGLFSNKLVNIDIVKLVGEITASAVPYAQQKDINLMFETEPEEKIVALNEDGIEKIVLNVLSNALKFTSKGGNIVVKVTGDSDKVKISIKDDGIGIPRDKKHFIFERFAQVDSSFRRVAEGSGIGLSIVKSIAELYKWEIDVVSEEGRGSEFIIYIPDKITDVEASHQESLNKDMTNAANIEFSDI